MASQWKKLRSLRSCAISQFNMDKLASHRTLETLGVEINTSSPVYVGRVPDTVQELLLSPRDTSLGTRYLENIHGSPTVCRLFIGMNHVDEVGIETLFQFLTLRLDTSCWEYLTVQPRSVFIRTPLLELPKLRTPLISALIQFSSLRELDLDLFCTSQLGDAPSTHGWQKSLSHLRHLKICTAKLSSVTRPCPVAAIVVVIAVVTYCPHLKTFCIPFNATISPPSSFTRSAVKSGEVVQEGTGGHEPGGSSAVTLLGEGDLVAEGRDVPVNIGHSPIADDAVGVLASCLKSLKPSLKQIQHHNLDEGWDAVQSALTC